MIKPVYLVHASDKSQWMHKFWFKYWDEFYGCKDIIPTVFLTESIDSKFIGIETYLTGTGLKWGEGLIQYLKQCEYEQIIYVHEDYFNTYIPINQKEKIIDLLDCFDSEEMNLLKMCGSWAGNPRWNKQETYPFFYDFTYFSNNFDEEPTEEKNKCYDIYKYNKDHDYLISHQTSIWNKNFLLSTLKPEYDGWKHEIYGTVELRKRNITLYCYLEESLFPYCETINRGNIRPGCEHFFKDSIQQNIDKDVFGINNANRIMGVI